MIYETQRAACSMQHEQLVAAFAARLFLLVYFDSRDYSPTNTIISAFVATRQQTNTATRIQKPCKFTKEIFKSVFSHFLFMPLAFACRETFAVLYEK